MDYQELEDRLDAIENRGRCESCRLFAMGFFLGFVVYVSVGLLVKWGCHAQDR